jgi:hypothetical protein
MIMKHRVLASLGAAAMMASVVSTGFAAVPVESDSSRADVDIVVTSTGVLSVLVTETERFDDISYSFGNQAVEGQLTIQVTDQRGTAAGWNFNLYGTGDFTGTTAGPGDSFPLTGLALQYASTTHVAGNTDISGISGSNLTQVTTTGQQIASATVNFGNGEYQLLYDGDLLIPGDTLVDTYNTTIVVEVASAPVANP